MENKIAVLLTCHNRKKVTHECLERLKHFENSIDIYCVDDASTDGTFQMIESEFPNVNLIEGDGNLFWCRGMLKAWQHAVGSGIKYDYYFWLNDDLRIFEDAFDEVLECCRLTNNHAIVTGLVIESKMQMPIYGGSWNKKLIAANGEMNRVNGLNGNFVAVPQLVMKKVGLFDPVYHHDLGDVDYGLSAIEKGFEVFTTRKYIGETDGNLKSSHKRNRRWGVSMRERFRVLFSPLGSNPNITFHFMNKHRGIISALVYYAYVIGINILPDRIFKYIER